MRLPRSTRALFPVLGLAAGLQAGPIPPGSLELSGAFNYQSMEVEADEVEETYEYSVFTANPSLRFYPASNVFLGPTLTWQRQSDENSSRSVFAGGAEMGFITSSTGSNTYLYAGGGLQFARVAAEFDGGSGFEDEEDSETGNILTLFAGLKFGLTESFYLNLQPAFVRRSIGDLEETGFSFFMGFSGIISR